MKSALVLTVFSTLLVAACGGGGSDATSTGSSTITNARGVWGATTDTSPPDFPLFVIRGNGDAWVFNYDAFALQGLGVMRVTETGNDLTSSSGKYFSESSGALDFSLSASAIKASSFGGTITFPSLSASATFTSTPRDTQEIDLSAIARSWDVGDDGLIFTVESSGAFEATNSSGCVISGTITPTGEGLALGTITANSNASCRLASESLSGIIHTVGNSSIWVGLINAASDNRYFFTSRTCVDGTTYSGVDFLWSCDIQ